MAYTHRRNINRGYMKLEVWNDAIELLTLVNEITKSIRRLDLKLKIALGSSGESMTRMVGLKKLGLVSEERFEDFDKLHFEMGNKLLALVALSSEKAQGRNMARRIEGIVSDIFAVV